MSEKSSKNSSRRWDLYCITQNKLPRRDSNRFGPSWRHIAAMPSSRKNSKLRSSKVPQLPSSLLNTHQEDAVPVSKPTKEKAEQSNSQDSGYGPTPNGTGSLDLSAPSSPFCFTNVFDGDVVL